MHVQIISCIVLFCYHVVVVDYRVDFNIPMKDGKITNTQRLAEKFCTGTDFKVESN